MPLIRSNAFTGVGNAAKAFAIRRSKSNSAHKGNAGQ
jgi:hypothetical protein